MTASLFSLARCWRAALLLAAVACLSPGRASAGCGDYVTILNGTGSAAHDAPSDGGQTPTKPPCDGPNCKGAPARHVPPLAPVVPAGPQAKELTQHLGPASGADADPGFGIDRGSTSLRPIRRASSIFHPPRLG